MKEESQSEELSPRQLEFVLYYLATGNGTKSYQLAYAEELPEIAAPAASRLLKHPKVKGYNRLILALEKLQIRFFHFTPEKIPYCR